MIKTTMLKKNYEFRNVLTRGKKYSGKYIDIYVTKNRLAENKIGIAVSSKSANSVNRNRIKRLIRENYKAVETQIQTGNSLVFLWKKNRKVEDATYYNIKEDIENFIQNAQIINAIKPTE